MVIITFEWKYRNNHSKMFTIPRWIQQHNNKFQSFAEIPEDKFGEINRRLALHKRSTVVVSILIAAWNEETNILNCISSLSVLETQIPFEIIVINNNSTDKTQQTLDRLDVISLFQPIQGCGPARQLGQEQAKGKYILLADADCIYPPCWLDEMMAVLTKKNVVCVYGRYSFIPEVNYPRWKLFLLERMKDIITEVRHFKRPYLNAYGISMGYIKEFGLKVGYVMYKVWGDDGRICFDLMQYGEVRQVKNNRSRVWTSPRTLHRDGSFSKAMIARVKKELKRLSSMIRPLPPHDTKTSKN
ncbi:MAG: glycosyltransferase family 2 protein [Parapedobacter sp.]